MDIILELADKIRGRIVILKDSYFALVEDSKGKIETNNNKINDLSAQIDQITGEIAKLSEETKRVQEDYGSIEGNLNEAKKDSGEYGLINGSAIEEIINKSGKHDAEIMIIGRTNYDIEIFSDSQGLVMPNNQKNGEFKVIKSNNQVNLKYIKLIKYRGIK